MNIFYVGLNETPFNIAEYCRGT